MDREGYVLVKGCAGLGNRLLTIANALAYALRTHRWIGVDWRDGKYGALDEEVFSEFFTLPEPFVPLGKIPKKSGIYPKAWPVDQMHAPIYALCKPCKNSLLQISKRWLPRGRARMLNQHWQYLGSEASKESLGSFAYLVSALRPSSFPYGSDLAEGLDEAVIIFSDYLPTVSQIQLQQLPPLSPSFKATVQVQMDKIRRQSNDVSLVGLHVRYTDLKPQKSLDHLVQWLQQCLDPTDGIFLATDSPEVQPYISEHLPNPIWKQDIAFADDFARGLHRTQLISGEARTRLLSEALTDMCVLSLCEWLFYQSNSSFSEVARAWHGKPAQQAAWDVS